MWTRLGTKTVVGRNANRPNFTTNRNIFNKVRTRGTTRKARRQSVQPYNINIKNNTVIPEGDMMPDIY